MKKIEKEKVYRLEGDYIESCNCATICPCLLNSVGGDAIPPTDGHCDLLVGYTIKKGHYYDVDLANLSFVIAIYSAGPLMTVPNWSIAYYVDERASDEQFGALEKIITGEAGGCPERLKDLRDEMLGCERSRIEIKVEEKYREVTVGEVGHMIVEGVTGLSSPDNDEEVLLANCHSLTQNGDVILGKTRKMFYRDHGFNFLNSGKSSVYGYYIWQENCDTGCPE